MTTLFQFFHNLYIDIIYSFQQHEYSQRQLLDFRLINVEFFFLIEKMVHFGTRLRDGDHCEHIILFYCLLRPVVTVSDRLANQLHCIVFLYYCFFHPRLIEIENLSFFIYTAFGCCQGLVFTGFYIIMNDFAL